MPNGIGFIQKESRSALYPHLQLKKYVVEIVIIYAHMQAYLL